VYLGIDLGTSSLKLLLLDAGHRVVATASQALEVSRPQPQWSEQDPRSWWTALEQAMQRLHADHSRSLAAVRAIGLSGQMHGAVLLDVHDAVLRPAILWNDGRSACECAALTAALPALSQVTGNVAMPGFTAPKLLWLRAHEPACADRVARVLLPKDWLRLQLTGDAVSDLSDASGTLWLDVGRRDWWDQALAACGLGRAQMPRLVEGSDTSGTLRVSVARALGLPAGIPVAGGAGDNAASAVGVGAVQAGQGFLSLGTSGVLFVSDDCFAPDTRQGVHTFCHALPGRWHRMSVMLSAASALRWATTLLGLPGEAALLDRVNGLTPAQRAGAPLFLPYLDGERTPHNDPHAQGVLFGLRHGHGAAEIGYAVIEGVGFGLLDGWRALRGRAKADQSLVLVGGGARSARWAQLLASTLGVDLQQPVDGDAAAALGAARLAWLADGGSPAEVCCVPAVRRHFEPDADEVRLLAPRAHRFRALYPALRDEFRDVAGQRSVQDGVTT
jgi:xylulokinase